MSRIPTRRINETTAPLCASVIGTLGLTLFLLWLTAISAAAQERVWSGNVGSNGSSVPALTLQPGTTYTIAVSGQVYFGVWWQNGRRLLNDACYEFNAKGSPDPLPVFKNNLNIPVCDGQYRANHGYRSGSFVGNGQRLEFWIFDTDYRDNSGSLRVDVFADRVAPPPPVQTGDLLGSWAGCRGRIATFTLENGLYIGRWTRIGDLGTYGFQVNEIGFRARQLADGRYEGDVKWRWVGGNFQWRKNVITIKGDVYTDTASDACSRRMTRVRS